MQTTLDPRPTAAADRLSRRTLANALRMLAVDAVQRADSGHPGAPMGMADIAEVLWNDFLRHNPGNPRWPDRDRFVLSNGHGSMLQYALLHLSGYDLPQEELQNFRQLHSKTPGHPEVGLTPGVETTTGPLGQGLANAVGMAMAERLLAERFNRPGHELVNHHTYVLLGDGCLMEGISHEACSLAGTLGLGKLIAFYDDNGISIDGAVSGWFADDTPARFRAYGWQVIDDVDGHDSAAIQRAIVAAREDIRRPTLICCKTVIGWGAPTKAGSHDVHGAPLGVDEVAATRRQLGWEHGPFEIPTEIRRAWDARQRGAQREADWDLKLTAYRRDHPRLAAEFERRMAGELPGNWRDTAGEFLHALAAGGRDMATRKASQAALDGFGPLLPELVGGSADLTPSNNTFWKGSRAVTRENFQGNYVHFGVREFGMFAVLNGLGLHGGFIPYGGTFLVFSDYARSALRMAALTKAPTVMVFTHDSIGLGEDGPTHQPVEHLAALRLIPNLPVWRPCDDLETAVAWRAALERRDGPTALVLSRQNLPHQPRGPDTAAAIQRGGYVLADCEGTPEVILIATGSEVALAVAAAAPLSRAGRRVRVVSLPCLEVFEAQPAGYRAGVLPPDVEARVVIEAGSSRQWAAYSGRRGRVIGLDSFGESAPGQVLFEHFGFTVEAVVQAAEAALAGPAERP